jgi:hypothetical protein
MSEKELYKQKKQAQLDEWKAEVDKLKAKTSGASADAQLKMIKQIKSLESRIEDAKARLAEITNAGEDAWKTLKKGVESSWDSLKSAVNEAKSKFKS